MKDAREFDALIVGHLTKDRLVRGGVASVVPGGAVYYAALTMARLGLRVAVSTRLASEDVTLLDELTEEGVEVHYVAARQTSVIENRFEPSSDRRLLRMHAFAGPFEPDDVPEVPARLCYLAPVTPGEMSVPFIRRIGERAPLALDVQGMTRRQVGEQLELGDWPEKEEALRLTTFVKADDLEGQVLTGEHGVIESAKALAKMGPREVLLTHKGGVIGVVGKRVFEGQFRPRDTVGRTGRGDTCFAAYLARRLMGAPPDEAVRFAAALTTLKLERPGPFRGTIEDVCEAMGRGE